jgi:hypothetical protein
VPAQESAVGWAATVSLAGVEPAAVCPLPADSVVRRFVRGGRLVTIPARHGKRLLVLDWLSQQFEPGRVYPESAVNAILARFHPDYASLRRYLVDEGFMARRHGFYWRAGGSFDVDAV